MPPETAARRPVRSPLRHTHGPRIGRRRREPRTTVRPWPSPTTPPMTTPSGIRSPTWAPSSPSSCRAGEGVWVYDAEAGATSTAPRASGTPTSATAGGDRPTRSRRRWHARRVLDVRRLRQPSRPRAGRPARRARADGRREGVPRLGRRRRDRHGGEDRPPPLDRGDNPSACTYSAAPTATTAPTAFGTSIAGIAANAANWGPLVPHTSAVPHDSLAALEQEILRSGPSASPRSSSSR